MKKKKPVLFLALEALLVAALLLLPGQCQGSRGANLTVTGTVFCDACSSSSFSNHSYFLPDVKVRIDCAIRASTASKEEIKITAEKTTDSHGAYRLDIPAVAGLGCTTGGEAASFCRAAVLDNPSPLCDVPAVTTTAGHISFSARDPDACLYNLNSLYYRPGNKAGQCDGAGASTPAAAALNTSLFYCPHWPWPPIPFCTPRPWFPPIPFFTPPPPAFPFPFPPFPFFTPPSPPPPAFPFPLPPWPWTPHRRRRRRHRSSSLICHRFSRHHLRRRPRRRRLHSRSLCRRFHSYLLSHIFRLCRRCIRHRLLRPRPRLRRL
uniref:Pollen-specific protein-like protein n=1 Tax=Aegilops tauschii subsp. strangulata TaxID=200361 RepID=A0A453CU24_AEGTS